MKTGERKRERFLLLLILALGLFARVWLFGRVPGGLNQDEAFAGYEAWSLLTTGRDTAGYPFPVYLTAWGSGMNALETYLMLPLVALFGLKVWVIRLPQLLVGLLSIGALYGVGRRMAGTRAGLAAAFLLAVCPWHVLLSRWGLESNLAPGFLLFGLYFFLRGLEDSRFFLLSALSYGLSLYAYATIWPLVPLMLLLQMLYCAAHRRLRPDGRLLLSALLLGALALPLLLFLAVNFGWIEEIVTPCFSIPRLLYMRAGEISLKNMPGKWRALCRILFRESDGLPWNSAGPFGLGYHITWLFALGGLALALRRLCRKGAGFRPEALVLPQLLAALLLGALVEVNVNRVNLLFIPLVLLAGLGLGWLWERRRAWAAPFAAVYLLLFVCFQTYYFTGYRQEIGRSFGEGLEQALAAAETCEGTVCISESVYYPQVLFFTRTPADEFRATVEYRAYPAAYLQARSFGRFVFGFDPAAPDRERTYILDLWADKAPFVNEGFTLRSFGNYTLATMG